MGQDLSHVVPCAAEDDILRVSDHSLEEVSSERSVALHVAQFWFDGGSSSQVPFEYLAELSGAADEDGAPSWVDAVPVVSLVHERGGWHLARQPLDLFELAFERVPVVRILWAAHGAHDKTFLVRYRQARLDAEFIGLVRFPLRDALHLGRMQAVDLPARRALLREDQLGKDQRALVLLEGRIINLPLNVPHHPACHGLQIPKHLPRTLELLGLRVASMLADAPFHALAVTLASLMPSAPAMRSMAAWAFRYRRASVGC